MIWVKINHAPDISSLAKRITTSTALQAQLVQIFPSFTRPYEKVAALVRPSGSAKIDHINLLLRRYEPQGGSIAIVGADLLSFTRGSWPRRLCIAGQDVGLVDGKVAQNIRLARHDASMDEVRAVCDLTETLADMDAIPEGFNARMGPAGLSVSVVSGSE